MPLPAGCWQHAKHMPEQSRGFPNMSMKITGVEAIILESPKDYGVDAHEAAGPRGSANRG